MNYLFDENLDPTVANMLSLLGAEDGDEFHHILEVAEEGTDDMDIPGICRENGFGALVTVNYKDFGAKKAIYLALLAAGIHVVVLRPGKIALKKPVQAGILSMQYPGFSKLIDESAEPTLVRVTATDSRERSIEELIAEFSTRD